MDIMQNQISPATLTTSDELHDKCFIFKILEDPSLQERLKHVEKFEVFTPLKEFCKDQLKVTFIKFKTKISL